MTFDQTGFGDASVALGQGLVKAGLLTETQLKQALEFQRATGGDLKDIVVKLGHVRDHVLTDYIARAQHMHSCDPEAMEVDEELMSKIPREVIDKHQILPLKSDHGTVLLALSDPNDFAAIDEIQFLTNRPVESALAPRASIRKVINLYYQRAASRPKTPAAGTAGVVGSDSSSGAKAVGAGAGAGAGAASGTGAAGGSGSAGAGAGAAGAAAGAGGEGPSGGPISPDVVKAVLSLPEEVLVRAAVLALIESGRLSAERLLALAGMASEGEKRGGRGR